MQTAGSPVTDGNSPVALKSAAVMHGQAFVFMIRGRNNLLTVAGSLHARCKKLC